MTDQKTQLTWHTVWTLAGMMVGFATIAMEIFQQYQTFRDANELAHSVFEVRITKLEARYELLEKHMENIQFQLDHERSTH